MGKGCQHPLLYPQPGSSAVASAPTVGGAHAGGRGLCVVVSTAVEFRGDMNGKIGGFPTHLDNSALAAVISIRIRLKSSA